MTYIKENDIIMASLEGRKLPLIGDVEGAPMALAPDSNVCLVIMG